MPVQSGEDAIYFRHEYLLLYPIIGFDTRNNFRVYDSEYSDNSSPLKHCLR